MKNSIISMIVSGLLIAITFGCKKGGSQPDPVIADTIKPTISIIRPAAGQAFVHGNAIAFQATFSDNEKLGSYGITITKVITGGLILKSVPTPVDWTYTKPSTNFSSGVKQQEINLSDIVIPVDISGKPVATGKYNFKVTCVDASRNSATSTVEININ